MERFFDKKGCSVLLLPIYSLDSFVLKRLSELMDDAEPQLCFTIWPMDSEVQVWLAQLQNWASQHTVEFIPEYRNHWDDEPASIRPNIKYWPFLKDSYNALVSCEFECVAEQFDYMEDDDGDLIYEAIWHLDSAVVNSIIGATRELAGL